MTEKEIGYDEILKKINTPLGLIELKEGDLRYVLAGKNQNLLSLCQN